MVVSSFLVFLCVLCAFVVNNAAGLAWTVRVERDMLAAASLDPAEVLARHSLCPTYQEVEKSRKPSDSLLTL
jgi:hypothetical protein